MRRCEIGQTPIEIPLFGVIEDLNDPRGYRTVEQGARQAVKMALSVPDGPTGTFTDNYGTGPR